MTYEVYHSWQGVDYPTYSFTGRYVKLYVRTNDLPLIGEEHFLEFLDRCDMLYSNMRDTLGWEPGVEGPLSIALAVDTCGSGCGTVGAKGIEVEVDFGAYNPPERISGGLEAVWAIIIHEMSHNFDPISGPIFYTSDAAHAWTTFFSFYSMVADGNGSPAHFPSFQSPERLLHTMAAYFFDPYMKDPTTSWSSCMVGAGCDFPSREPDKAAKQRGAQGGLFLEFARLAGPEATGRLMRYLIGQIMPDPGHWVGAPATQKADLFAKAMSVALEANITPAFGDWKWYVGDALKSQLATAFPGIPAFVVDHDGDGFSALQGDRDDHLALVFPKADPTVTIPVATNCSETVPVLPVLTEDTDFPLGTWVSRTDCGEFSDLPLLIETTDFPEEAYAKATLQTRLPPEVDRRFCAFRTQLFLHGLPVTPVTARRVVPALRQRSPLTLVGNGLQGATLDGTYAADFLVNRHGSSPDGPGELLLDGQVTRTFASLPSALSLGGLTSGVHTLQIQTRLASGEPADSTPFTFVIFESPELNNALPITKSKPPYGLRDIRLISDLKATHVGLGDLHHFEGLQSATLKRLSPADAFEISRLPVFRRLGFPSSPEPPEPQLFIEARPSGYLRLRGIAYGRSARIQRSSDLRHWEDVPFSEKASPDSLLEVETRPTEGPGFFRVQSM